MAKTYLQMVNMLNARLKNEQAASVNGDTDSLLLGGFVNEAKDWMQEDHRWRALRHTIRVTTEAGTFEYSLTGAGVDSSVIQVFDNTNDYEFGEAAPYRQMNKWLNANDVPTGQPTEWDFNGVDGNYDEVVNFYPIPDDAYNIEFNLYTPQADLEEDDDILIVPYRPVFLYALALAIEERGEEGGMSADKLITRADVAKAKAVQVDKETLDDEYVMEFE